jgi:hypothetical protein
VGYNAPAKKGVWPLRGPVNKLIRNHEMAWGNLFPQAAYGAGSYNSPNAKRLHAENIRTKIYFSGQPAVSPAMTWNENQFGFSQPAFDELVGRFTEGGLNSHLPNIL